MPSTYTATFIMTQKIDPPTFPIAIRSGLAEGEHTSVWTIFQVEMEWSGPYSGQRGAAHCHPLPTLLISLASPPLLINTNPPTAHYIITTINVAPPGGEI